MRIERYGSGSRRFLGLHGWNGDHRTFLPLVDALPPDVCFLSADLPGCGLSRPPARWDLDCIADEVANELTGPTTLVGNCSGAVVALLVARRVPQFVSRVVMIDAFAFWPWYFRLFIAPGIGRVAYFSTFANPVGRWIANASLRSRRAPTTNLTRGFADTNHEFTFRYLTMLRDAGVASEFADCLSSPEGAAMPLDILRGARSFHSVRHSAAIWAHMWPHARTFELKGAGHLPILEAAAEVRSILFEGDMCSTKQPVHTLNCAL